jgi:hypothetical protein
MTPATHHPLCVCRVHASVLCIEDTGRRCRMIGCAVLCASEQSLCWISVAIKIGCMPTVRNYACQRFSDNDDARQAHTEAVNPPWFTGAKALETWRFLLADWWSPQGYSSRDSALISASRQPGWSSSASSRASSRLVALT